MAGHHFLGPPLHVWKDSVAPPLPMGKILVPLWYVCPRKRNPGSPSIKGQNSVLEGKGAKNSGTAYFKQKQVPPLGFFVGGGSSICDGQSSFLGPPLHVWKDSGPPFAYGKISCSPSIKGQNSVLEGKGAKNSGPASCKQNPPPPLGPLNVLPPHLWPTEKKTDLPLRPP